MKNLFFYSALFLFLSSCCENEPKIEKILGKVPLNEENSQTKSKIELGRTLFFDKRLSRDGTVSCASCHNPDKAFTDQKELSDGVFDRKSMRNAPTLLNVAYQKNLMFDGHITNLEEQSIVPIQDHFEMDMEMKYVIKRLKKVNYYQKSAKHIFNREFDAYVLTRALAVFQRTLVSYGSPFDQYFYGNDENAISASAKRGWKLFSKELYCTKCHPAPHFTNFETVSNGYYQTGSSDKGRFRIHLDSADIGKFKVPTLRNISITFPYMHDGKLKSLEDVLKHYEKGGKRSENQSKIIDSIQLTTQNRKDLVEFLKSLTDGQYRRP